MKPVFKLKANSQDITKFIENRLLSLSISDEYGLISDSMTIELDDHDEAFAFPDRGAEIEAFLGYSDTALYSMGTFIADEVEISGPSNVLTVTSRAANSLLKNDMGKFMAPRTFSWEETTPANIISTIAQRYGLKPSISKELKTIYIDHLDQTDESDCALLQRLSKDYSSVVKIAGGVLLFFEPARGKRPDGTSLPKITIDIMELSKYRLRISDRNKYNTVKAKYYDFDEAEEKTVTVGQGEPIFSLRETFTSRMQAQRRAKGKLEEIKRGQRILTAEMIGNPLISAESLIEITKIREELSGTWVIKRANHNLDTSGYKTSIEATRPIDN